jgi:NADH-quinone oxidoreductase subunit F
MAEKAEKVVGARFGKPNSHLLSTYVADGGYRSLKILFSKKPEEIMEIVKVSNLRGRGGAGYQAAKKWGQLPQNTGRPCYLCVNADEGEPGTFKDRYIMEDDPHALIEGSIICSYAVNAHAAYIYVRGEFKEPMARVQSAIDEAYAKGYLGKNIQGSGYDLEMFVHPGAGSYICGEKTALIDSLEGKRGWPRLRPPSPTKFGFFEGPTTVNNVETLACLPHILNNGPEWFVALGYNKSSGTKLFGVSGHVKQPGLYELPMGTSLKKIIYEVAGGIRNDRPLKAVIPGGLSAPVLLPDEIDVHMDFESMFEAGSMLGSAGVIVMDDTVCMPWVAAGMAKFYAHESCGQCSPCREGSGWVRDILLRIEAGKGREGDIDLVLDVCKNIGAHAHCRLAESSDAAIVAMVTKFRKEFEEHIFAQTCTVGPLPNPWDNEKQ